PAQYGRGHSGRPGAHGPRLRRRRRGRAAGLRSRADADVRHGRAVDAGGRHAVLRPGRGAVTGQSARGTMRQPLRQLARLEGFDVFYPIVPDAEWIARLVPLGIRTVQLRVKDASPQKIAREIAASLELTRRHGCQLIVNDYWREALAA